jgi:hypothetical protein
MVELGDDAGSRIALEHRQPRLHLPLIAAGDRGATTQAKR